VGGVSPTLRVAFQGELGAFSEEAVHRFFGDDVEPIPCRDFTDVGRVVVDGEVDYGVLPIENSLAGSVVASYDVLAGNPLEIVGEVITPIHHCILGVPGATLEGLQRIMSHPVALMQCGKILRSMPQVEVVAVYDTAGAAKDVADQRDPTRAAIAARRAAKRYGLDVLAENVEDRDDNQTRFLVVIDPARTATDVAHRRDSDDQGPMKTAVLLETSNVPGALLRVLSPFADRGINLSKLESRPAGEPWTYRFFVELDADASSEQAQLAIADAAGNCRTLRILGSYPRWIG
jgi:prephenate dehydratase/chorismate mutase/prephenate dehydratase